MFLKSEIELNNTLEPKIDAIIAGTSKEGSSFFERKVSELTASKGDPKAPRPPTGKPDQPSYDDMVLALLTTVADEVKGKGVGKDTEERSKALEKALKEHRRQLSERTEQCRKQIAEEEAEQKKHITSEDLHDGFNAGVGSRNPCESTHAELIL